MSCAKVFMKTWVILTQLFLIALGSFIIYSSHHFHDTIDINNFNTPLLTIGSVFIVCAALLLFATFCADSLLLCGILIWFFSLVMFLLFSAETLTTITTGAFYSVVKNVNAGSYDNTPYQSGMSISDKFGYDINVAMFTTWNSCCTKQYNTTIEIPVANNDIIKRFLHYKVTNDIMEIPVKLQDVCSKLEETYTDNNWNFGCGDNFGIFRDNFISNIVARTLLDITIVAGIAAVLSLITTIFSCSLACNRKDDYETINDNRLPLIQPAVGTRPAAVIVTN